MSTTTAATTTAPPLPANEGTLAQRLVRGAITPGGAVFVLLAVLFVAVVLSNPSFGEPPQLIRFIGRTAPARSVLALPVGIRRPRSPAAAPVSWRRRGPWPAPRSPRAAAPPAPAVLE